MSEARLPPELRYGLPERAAAEACGLTVREFREARLKREVPGPARVIAGRELWSAAELQEFWRPKRQKRHDPVASDAADLDLALRRHG